MTHDIDRWFSDPEVGLDWQDFDLVLADLAYLPRMITYLDDARNPARKKVEIISALLELLEHDCPKDSGEESERRAEQIRGIIRQHSGVAESALPSVGIVKDVVLRQILGSPIPKDYPQWIIDRAREEAGA